MQAKHRSDKSRRSDSLPGDRRIEMLSILGAVALAVLIGVIVGSIVWGFVAIFCLGLVGLVAIRLLRPRRGRPTSTLAPRHDGAHAHQHH